ncbi:hypothetical protein J4H27_08735 [Vibrio alginolyticus]|uniref:hypothetical protein n=1 Tax=Vibrio TaxID=662 RepID=UPI001BD34264|nr:hypothetical protein [Vibrio alginolyticus]
MSKATKSDFIDASAIAEAAGRPTMRFVAVKSEEAQIIAAIHRVTDGYFKERTAAMSRKAKRVIARKLTR